MNWRMRYGRNWGHLDMKSNWITTTLDEVCSLVTDGAHNSPRSVERGYYMASVKDFTEYGFDFSKCRKISKEDYEKLRRQGCVPQKEDVLVGKDGARYFEDIIIYRQDEQPALLSSIAILRVNRKKITPEFLYYTLKTPAIKKDVRDNYGSGSAIPRIVLKDFKRMPFSYPNIDEQQKITAVCSAIDEKIQVNNVINKNLLQQLHVLYLRLFCDSAMDTPLGNVVATTSGGTPSRKHDEYYSDSSICWVKSKELLGNYIHETEEHINDLAIKKSSAKLLPKYSILIAMYGATVGAYGVISKPMTCNQAVCALFCNENYPYTYLFQIAYESQQKFINLAIGSAQQNISQVLIKQLNLHSDLDIIQRFHELALPMHQEIEFLQAENIRLSNLRDNLLPKLMSGELDVSNVEI